MAAMGKWFRMSWVAAGLLVIAASGQGAEPQGARPDLLYHNYCSVCHGDRGDGQSRARNSLVPPPRDFTRAPDLPRDYMIQVVTQGKPGTAMVGWKTQLSEADIVAVVDYIRTRFMVSQVAPTAPVAGVSGASAHGGRQQDGGSGGQADMSLGFASALKGDAQRGERFYRANCATCHGQKGDGQGPRAYFIRPKPRNFLDPGAQRTLNRPVLFAAVSMGRQGSEMPAWSKVLSDQEIADVAEFVFVKFIRTEPPKRPAK